MKCKGFTRNVLIVNLLIIFCAFESILCQRKVPENQVFNNRQWSIGPSARCKCVSSGDRKIQKLSRFFFSKFCPCSPFINGPVDYVWQRVANMETVYPKMNAFRSEVSWAVHAPKAMAFVAFVS